MVEPLRITARFAGDRVVEVDLAVPPGSTALEILPEAARLCGVPAHGWQACTVAGARIDRCAPLAASLSDGAHLVFRHPTDTAPPLARDVTAALAVSESGLGRLAIAPRSAAHLLATVGALAAGLLMPSAFAGALACVGVAVLGLAWDRSAWPLGWIGIVAGSAALVLWIGEPLRLGVIAGLAAGITGAVLLAAARISTFGPATLCASLIAAAGAGVGLWNEAAALLFGVGAGALSPRLAATLAGLRVPALPAAGQPLDAMDDAGSDPDAAARRARSLYRGITIGSALAVAGSAAAVALLPGDTPGWLRVILPLVVAASSLLHGLRHVDPWAVWAWLGVLGICLGAAAYAAEGWWRAAPGTATAVAVTTPIWFARIPTPSPAALAWFERVEGLCLAASLPLAAHAAGLFVFIRGLG